MTTIADARQRTGAILVVEDDPEVRELLELFLKDEGHHVATAPDGITALELVARGAIQPDLILADYNLPNGMNGLQLVAKLREKLHRQIPVIILTGDISTGHLARYRASGLRAAQQAGQGEGADAGHPASPADSRDPHGIVRLHRTAEQRPSVRLPIIFVVDDDSHIREAIRSVLEDDGRSVEDYAAARHSSTPIVPAAKHAC